MARVAFSSAHCLRIRRKAHSAFARSRRRRRARRATRVRRDARDPAADGATATRATLDATRRTGRQETPSRAAHRTDGSGPDRGPRRSGSFVHARAAPRHRYNGSEHHYITINGRERVKRSVRASSAARRARRTAPTRRTARDASSTRAARAATRAATEDARARRPRDDRATTARRWMRATTTRFGTDADERRRGAVRTTDATTTREATRRRDGDGTDARSGDTEALTHRARAVGERGGTPGAVVRGAGGGGGGRRDDEGRIRRRTRDALRENARAISRHQGEIYALTVEIERRRGGEGVR